MYNVSFQILDCTSSTYAFIFLLERSELVTGPLFPATPMLISERESLSCDSTLWMLQTLSLLNLAELRPGCSLLMMIVSQCS